MVENIELILSLLINIGLIIGWILSGLNHSIKKKSVKHLFGSYDITIYFPARNLGRQAPVIATEDFYAANSLAEFVRSHGVKTELKHIPPDSQMHFKEGSVVICGPKSSKTNKEILETDSYYQFNEDDDGIWRVMDQTTGNELMSPSDKRPSENKDIAYFGRLRLHKNDQNHFTLIAGIHAVGSYGGVHYLCNMRNIKKIRSETKDRCFSTLIIASYDMNSLEILSSDILMPIKIH